MMELQHYLGDSIAVLEATIRSIGAERVDAAVESIIRALSAGKPLLVCGNGGSAADAMHLSGELVGRFLIERKALNVVCLCANPVVLTAWSNDYDFSTIFARQVEAHGQKEAVLLGISTSGNSVNVVRAFETARALGMVNIGLTGEGGGRLGTLAHHLLAVPSRRTPLIQQAHLCLYHYLCLRIEERMGVHHD